MKNLQIKIGSLFLAGILVLSSCEKETDNPTTPEPELLTVAATAQANGNFTILLDALTRTGLAGTMDDATQNLTVFAPTDQAFMDLLADLNMSSLDEVETALGNDGLKNVLLYHVLGTKVTSNMVNTGYAASLGMSASMSPLSIYVNTNNGVMLNGKANVTTADVMANNGVIHIINKVILPLSVFELLELNSEYATLTAALGLADGGLDALLSDPTQGPFTLFAPDEMAFSSLLTELSIPDVPTLVSTLGTDGLASVLTYHVLSGNINSGDVPSGDVATVNGDKISINLSNGVMITDVNNRMSTVMDVDIQGTNGVIHTIDKVLLPK